MTRTTSSSVNLVKGPIIATDNEGNVVSIVTTSGQHGYVGNLVVGFDEDGDVVTVDEDANRLLRVVCESIGDPLELTDTVTEFVPEGCSTGNLSTTQMSFPTTVNMGTAALQRR